MVGFAGVTAIEVNSTGAACTVRVCAGLVTPPFDALIWVVPADTEVARPAAFIVATPVALDDQVAEDVISAVLPSEYVPVAVNC